PLPVRADRPDRAPPRTGRAHRPAGGPDVGGGPGRRGPRPGESGPARRLHRLARPRLRPGAALPRRRVHRAGGQGGDRAGHPPLRPPPGVLVPPRPARALAALRRPRPARPRVRPGRRAVRRPLTRPRYRHLKTPAKTLVGPRGTPPEPFEHTYD